MTPSLPGCGGKSVARVLLGAADRGRYATDASIYQVQPLGVVIPRQRRRRPRRHGGRTGCRRARIGARWRHQPVRPDRQPRHRAGLLEIPAPGVVGRWRRRDGRTRHRAAAPEHGIAAPWEVLSRRPLDPFPLHHRRHGGEQLVRVEVDPLRADGRQRAGHRRHPRRRQHAPVRRRDQHGPRSVARPAAGHRGCGGGRDRRTLPGTAAPRRRLQHRVTHPRRPPRGPWQPRAAVGGFGGHAGVFGGTHAEAVADQAAQDGRHLPVPDLPRRYAGLPRPGDAHAGSRGADRPHHDRSWPRHSHLPPHHRPHAAGRTRQPAAGGVPWPL